jgi:hypothetical protein
VRIFLKNVHDFLYGNVLILRLYHGAYSEVFTVITEVQRLTGNSSSQDLFSQFYQTFQILPDTINFQGIFYYELACIDFFLFTEQFPGEIYFENSSKYYLKSSLNKLRIALPDKHNVCFRNVLGMIFENSLVKRP